MNVNHVSQQSPVENQQVQSVAKVAEAKVQQQLSPKSDTVILSEKAKDLAAQQAGKAVSEEANESMAAKQREALSQFEGVPKA
jgi:hypothetical protein